MVGTKGANAIPAEKVPPDKGTEEAGSDQGGVPPPQTTIPAQDVGEKPQHKTVRAKKARVPWTEQHYREHKASVRASKVTQGKIPERESTYKFLYDGFVDPVKVECLHIEVEDWDGGYESDTTTSTNPHVDDLQEVLTRNWGTLFTGVAALRSGSGIADGPNQEEEERTFSFSEDEDDYDLNRGPTPRISFRMAAIAVSEGDEGIELEPLEGSSRVTIKSWRKGSKARNISKPILFQGHFDTIPCTIMLDPGSGTDIMCRSFAEKNGVKTSRSDGIRLKYGDGKDSFTNMITTPKRVAIQDVKFDEEFYVNPHELPGVDIILGMSFMDKFRAEIRYPTEKGDQDLPYVWFPGNKKMYTKYHLLGGAAVDCQCISTTEAYAFLQEEQRRNKSLVDVEVYAVSVQKEMEMKGRIDASTATIKDIKEPRLQALVEQYKDIFREDLPLEEVHGRVEQSFHEIPLEDGAHPLKMRPIPVSGPKLEIMHEMIAKLVKNGVLEKGDLQSPWGSPILLLRKAGNRPGLSNAYRLVCDYRALNAVSKKPNWSPPTIKDMLDDLVGCTWFSKTDATSGFYQQPILPEDRDKTTFRIRGKDGRLEAYRFTVSSLGLAGCPASYQTFMEKVVAGIKGIAVYLDDTICFTKTLDEHVIALEAVFKRFRTHKVYLHPLKCEFGVHELEYLGLRVSKNRLQVAEAKVEAVKAYRTPDSYPALQRFLGFANYLKDFVPHYAEKIACLTDLLKGGVKKRKFTWTQPCQDAFDGIRRDLVAAVGLGIPDKSGDLVLETDASLLGIGACLYQYVNGRLHPLWFLSKKLSDAETRYSTRDREALAVVYALKKCEKYLHQKPFVLYSDHESLIYLKTQKELKTSRDWRWSEIMSEFDFEQRYKKGPEMFVPDALSRAHDRLPNEQGVWHDLDHPGGCVLEPKVGTLNSSNTEEVHAAYIKTTVSDVRNPTPGGIDITEDITKVLADEAKRVASGNKNLRRKEEEARLYSVGAKVYGDLGAIMKAAYPSDPDFAKIYASLQKPADEMSEAEKSVCRNYSMSDGLVFYTDKRRDQFRLCVPRNEGNGLRLTVLYEAHDSVLHGGREKTYDRLASKYWWPTIARDVRNYCGSCGACKRNASVQKRPAGVREAHEIPEGRWDAIHADWITDLPETQNGYDAILVVHDRVTKYAYLIPAKKCDTAEDTANRMFAQVFCVHGLPKTLVSDRDKLFTAKFFAQLMKILDVKQAMGTSYQHDFNGAAERLNRTVEVMLRHVVGDHTDRNFDEYLPMVQWAYNTTKHSATGVTPYYAMWGYEPRHPLDLPGVTVEEGQHRALEDFVVHQQEVLRQVRDALAAAQLTMDEYANRQTRGSVEEFKVHDKVFLSSRNLSAAHFKQTSKKLQPRFLGPFTIVKKVSKYTFELELPKSMSRLHPVFHVSLLWKDKPTPETLGERLTGEYTPATEESSATMVDEQVQNLAAPPSVAPTTTVDGNGKRYYNVAAVTDRKKVGKGYRWRVKWEGFPDDNDDTWEPKSSFHLGTYADDMRIEHDKQYIVTPPTSQEEPPRPDPLVNPSVLETPQRKSRGGVVRGGPK